MNDGGKRKNITRTVTWLALAVLSTAAGFALRRSQTPDPAVPQSEPSAVSAKSEPQHGAAATIPADDLIAEALAAAGGRPDIEAVFSSQGFDRYEKLSRFLVGATAADCAEIYTRWSDTDDLKHHCMDAILLRWTEVDPEGAAEKNSSAGLWAWAKNDPDAAFAYGLEHGGATSALRAIGQTNGRRGLQLLLEHPEAGDTSSWAGIASGLAKVDRRAGIEFALEKGIDLDDMMKTWARFEPELALRFTRNLENPRQHRIALEQLLSKFAEDDPESAAQIIDDLPPSEMREQFRSEFIKDLATRDLDRALEMAEAIGRPTEQTAALHGIAEQIAHADPDRAIELLTQSVEDPNAYGYSDDLARTLGQLRPEACLTHGIEPRQIAGEWVARDPERASAWIAEQPPSAKRDAMVHGLLHCIVVESHEPDFTAAVAWANTIDQQRHQDAYQNIFSRWMHADRAAALEAFDSPDIPASFRDNYTPPAPQP